MTMRNAVKFGLLVCFLIGHAHPVAGCAGEPNVPEPDDATMPDATETDVFTQAARAVCRIYVECKLDKQTKIGRGSGVVLKRAIQNTGCYFVCTAYHVIENLLMTRDPNCSVYLSDPNGVKLWTKDVSREHVVWRDRLMDAAIIALPMGLHHAGDETVTGIAFVKSIRGPSVGQDVFMVGRRWVRKNTSIPILKRGIVSTITASLPNHQGHKVILVDKMSNKGMSGGLLFAADGQGIGMIVSYVLESDQRVRTSDDLTVCIPLSILFQELNSAISEREDEILHLVRG